MAFMKYDFNNKNDLEIIRKSKEMLQNEIPVFNMISNTSNNDFAGFSEVQKLIGDKMNSIIPEQTEERYAEIIKDYKDYLNTNVEL